MKKLLLIFSMIIAARFTRAQTNTANLGMPHYHILKIDSTYTSWADLKKNKPVMLMYFSPDCPHCQHLTREILKNMDTFKGIQIVMITFTKTEYPFMNMIRKFTVDYRLAKYKNITMGTEYPDYLVQRYFQIATTPYVAFYDKSGKLIKTYDKVPAIADLMGTAKKM